MYGFYTLVSKRPEISKFTGQRVYVIAQHCGSEVVTDDEFVASVSVQGKGKGIIALESELDPIEFGIRQPVYASMENDLVYCNDCNLFLYEDCGDERDNNCLQVFKDEDNDFFKGCPCCKSDNALGNVNNKQVRDMITKSLAKKITIYQKKIRKS